jgi:hypothetical protein
MTYTEAFILPALTVLVSFPGRKFFLPLFHSDSFLESNFYSSQSFSVVTLLYLLYALEI